MNLFELLNALFGYSTLSLAQHYSPTSARLARDGLVRAAPLLYHASSRLSFNAAITYIH